MFSLLFGQVDGLLWVSGGSGRSFKLNSTGLLAFKLDSARLLGHQSESVHDLVHSFGRSVAKK